MIKRAMVTGASGFLGGHLAAQLEAMGVTVQRVGRAEVGNAKSKECWEHVLQRNNPDTVFHLMGQTRAENGHPFNDAHLLPVTALLDAIHALRLNNIRVILLGSAAEYGAVNPSDLPVKESQIPNPIGDYALSKLQATEKALSYLDKGLDICVVRLFNVFGRDMPAWLMPGTLLAKLKQQEPIIHLGSLNSVRDYLKVDVAMHCLAKLAFVKEAKGKTVNLCSGKGWILRDIVNTIVTAQGDSKKILEDVEASNRSSQVSISIGDNQLLKDLLGFKPTVPTLKDFIDLA